MIEDPDANSTRPTERVDRVLHFWNNGFSVDDGPLYRTDDPANAEILRLIHSGRAPMHIMHAQADQAVDVKLEPHNEDYVVPTKKYTPFGGGGQRLGSVTPGMLSSTSTPGPAPAASTTSASSTSQAVDINDSEPTIVLQIRLGDGTRLVTRFNVIHTVGDVYSFVSASNPSSQSRPWVLMTTFPSKELNDKNQVLGDMADFKRGGVIVQKWQ